MNHIRIMIEQQYHNTPEGYNQNHGTIGSAIVLVIHVNPLTNQNVYWRMFMGAGPAIEQELVDHVAQWGNCFHEDLARVILRYACTYNEHFADILELPYRA